MKLGPSIIAWLSIAGALSLWTGVILFSFLIGSMTDDITALQKSAQSKGDQQVVALKMHNLATELAPLRTQLESTLQTDPLALAGLITQSGKDAGVSLRVSDAATENLPQLSSAIPGLAAVQATVVGFSAGADGSFDRLIRAAAFLETLPAPSTIQELDFSRAPHASGAAASTWHMDTHIQMLTASHISP